jgi:DNA-binding NtrC family response regulator
VTGVDLIVEPLRTVGAGWLDAFARLQRYVAHHNLLYETEDAMRAEGLIVASRAMRAAVARVVRAARSGARALLLTGPSGAGKEGLARCFHRHTGRGGAFVARNCAMLGKDLMRAELFGAEKGSFTGSVQRIVGAVEAANEGTLFLDEIGELPRDVQPMFLRFLDRGEYERLGSYGRPKFADVRIVAATNRDLRAASLNDEFRMDLWFRLSVQVVEVPPLRERPEDVFAYLRSVGLPDGKSLFESLAPETLDVLTGHEWHGNFRELTNFAQRLATRAAAEPITAEVALESLREGALQPLVLRRTAPPQPPLGDQDVFATAIQTARAAFAEDHNMEAPCSWDQVKDLIENYVKPVLFATLSDSQDARSVDEIELRVVSERLSADRGTALKQLRRFFDRFGSNRVDDA